MNDIIKQNVLKLQNAKATPQDIETYVKSAVAEGAQTQSSPSPIQQGLNAVGGFAKSVGQSLLSGPATMIARPIQAANVGIGTLRSAVSGDPSYKQNAYNQLDQPLNIGGMQLVKPLSDETPESVAGEAASTVALGAVPGVSPATTGLIQGGLGGVGHAMQNNDSAGSVAGQGLLGAGLGYGIGKIAGAISNKIHPPTLDDHLWQSGAVTSQPQSSAVQSTLTDNGITSLADKEDVAFARNVLSNSLRDSQKALNGLTTVDPISGEMSPQTQIIQQRIGDLRNALQAVTDVSHYIGAGLKRTIGAGLLTGGIAGGTLLANTAQDAGKFLWNKFVGTNPIPSSLNQ